MIETDWQKTSTGSRRNVLDKYIPEIWIGGAGWFAGVNRILIKDDNGEARIFHSPEEAQEAAEEMAQEIMHSDELIDSSGN